MFLNIKSYKIDEAVQALRNYVQETAVHQNTMADGRIVVDYSTMARRAGLSAEDVEIVLSGEKHPTRNRRVLIESIVRSEQGNGFLRIGEVSELIKHFGSRTPPAPFVPSEKNSLKAAPNEISIGSKPVVKVVEPEFPTISMCDAQKYMGEIRPDSAVAGGPAPHASKIRKPSPRNADVTNRRGRPPLSAETMKAASEVRRAIGGIILSNPYHIRAADLRDHKPTIYTFFMDSNHGAYEKHQEAMLDFVRALPKEVSLPLFGSVEQMLSYGSEQADLHWPEGVAFTNALKSRKAQLKDSEPKKPWLVRDENGKPVLHNPNALQTLDARRFAAALRIIAIYEGASLTDMAHALDPSPAYEARFHRLVGGATKPLQSDVEKVARYLSRQEAYIPFVPYPSGQEAEGEESPVSQAHAIALHAAKLCQLAPPVDQVIVAFRWALDHKPVDASADLQRKTQKTEAGALPTMAYRTYARKAVMPNFVVFIEGYLTGPSYPMLEKEADHMGYDGLKGLITALQSMHPDGLMQEAGKKPWFERLHKYDMRRKFDAAAATLRLPGAWAKAEEVANQEKGCLGGPGL